MPPGAMEEDGTAASVNDGVGSGEKYTEGEAMAVDSSSTSSSSTAVEAAPAPQPVKPKLDADEMRRRRLAKLNATVPATTVATAANTTAPITNQSSRLPEDANVSAPKATSQVNNTNTPKASAASENDRNSSTHKQPAAKPHCPPAQLSSLLKFSQHVCGPHVKFDSSVTERVFESNPTLFLGESILDSCANFFSSSSQSGAATSAPTMEDMKKRYPSLSEGSLQSVCCLQFLQEVQLSADRASSDPQLSRLSQSEKSGLRDQCLDLTNQIKLITARYAVLVLSHFFNSSSFSSSCSSESCSSASRSDDSSADSVLLHCLTEKIVSFDFVALLCSVMGSEFHSHTFAQVMEPLLNRICCNMSVHYSVNDPICTSMFEMISTLAEIQVTSPSQKKPKRPILDFLPSLPNWLPPPMTVAEGREMQRLSFLGPFLSVSCLNEDDPLFATSVVPSGLSDFKDIVLFKKIQQTISSIRMKQFGLVHSLLVNQPTRGATLDYLSNLLTRNSKRAQMNPDSTTLATHGFMLNALSILCTLEKKVPLDKVDPVYLTHPRCRFDVSGESYLKMGSQQFSDYCSSLHADKSLGEAFELPKFNTECFFFTLFGCHVCFIPAIKHFSQVIRTYKQLKSVLAEAEKQQERMPSSFVESRLKEMKEQLESFYRSAVTMGAVLSEETLLADVLQYYAKVMDLLLSLVSGSTSASPHMGCTGKVESPSLPLSPEVPQAFASFPAFVIEDISDFVSFMVQHGPHILSQDPVSSRSLVNFLVTFSCSSNYISNPYLVAKMIEIIYYLNPAVQPSTVRLFNEMIEHREAMTHFAPCLIQFYVAIESTGSSNEFYDKFSIRYHLTIIFKSMWAHLTHKDSMIQALNSGGPFVRFVNLLINDTTFLLDESLECIKRIHDTQKLIKNTEEWNKLSREQQSAKKKKLAEDESQCKSYMTLVNETLVMFHYLTRDVQRPFLLPEIIGRLAAMLNCYLAQLVGPKYNELNIENREKYGFQPRVLLDQITDLYLHLDSRELVEAIAGDDRSYREEVFIGADETLKRVGLKTVSELERFMRIAADAKQSYVDNLRMEEDFEDAPDQYRDPITQTIMNDPVRLPSGKVMDRTVLTRILLDSAIDPFSRQPLSQENVQECPDLKLEIQNWKKEHSKR